MIEHFETMAASVMILSTVGGFSIVRQNLNCVSVVTHFLHRISQNCALNCKLIMHNEYSHVLHYNMRL